MMNDEWIVFFMIWGVFGFFAVVAFIEELWANWKAKRK